MPGTYDAESNTLYWTTGNPGPDFDGSVRPGNNLYTDCVLAHTSIEQTGLEPNNADAMQALNNGVHVTVSNSTIVSNQGYALNNLGSVVYTRGTNTIRGNALSELTNQNLGTITTLTGG